MFKSLLLLPILLTTAGCSVLKASPEKTSVFVPKPELLKENRARAPFHAYWVFDAKSFDKIKSQHQKIYIAPINISFVEKKINSASGNKEVKLERIEETQELANYFREILKINFREQAKGQIVILDQPETETLSIKLALVNLIPTNPGINFAGTIAGFLLPGGGLVKQFGEGSIAFEGYLDQGELENSLYEEFKDRESQKAAPFTLKDYQRYAHLRMIIDEWAAQITELYLTNSEHTVADSLPVSLDPL